MSNQDASKSDDAQNATSHNPTIMSDNDKYSYLNRLGITVWLNKKLGTTPVGIPTKQKTTSTAIPIDVEPKVQSQIKPKPVTNLEPTLEHTTTNIPADTDPTIPAATNTATTNNTGNNTTIAVSSTKSTLNWDELAIQVTQCQLCPELVADRTQTVFGTGNRQAKLLIIGEAPGEAEDEQGEPFVGRAGKLLDNILFAIGYKREDIYIANILKCRPPHNRNPSAEEAEHCQPWLTRQIELLNPQLILAVGAVPAQNLLKVKTPVGKLRNTIHKYGPKGIPLVVTYHPAYLLRAPGQKLEVWKDLQHIKKILS